ncbi:hypothetical protein [Gordonia hankookensis]|uniref:HhH-GPD domain-containing protein n=1 Tax=Gordonia hankookensis TaxID=589403 RepID=A0ABR7WCR6_9ACTN|nr:hypothetical protein [Gordonia hankookensis]MBD1320586.1 hypothetical protein [Gordonia hankookensis]
MDQVETLDSYITSTLHDSLTTWPGGWPGEIEAALIDAVFSIQARYGGPHSGVRAVVSRWRDYQARPLDDLDVLAQVDPADFVRIVGNSSRASGRLKAAIVVDAARALIDADVHHARQFGSTPDQKTAYLSVKGCGPVTWSYLGMLLGSPDIKADTWILRFVEKAVGHHVTSHEARQWLTAVAAKRDVNATELDHAVWNYARRNLA